ncbi:hypothetical protein TNCV_2603611 [Trichonephila clavipes]|nr:hypothetical protein TNCV_2603611 [Trichonephila clavipes]
MSCTQSMPGRKHLKRCGCRPESSTRAVAHHVIVSHQTVCRVLNENRLHLFHFQRVQALLLFLLMPPDGQ